MDAAFDERLVALRELAEGIRLEVNYAAVDAAIEPLIRYDLNAYLQRGVAREKAIARATKVAIEAAAVRRLASADVVAKRVERAFRLVGLADAA